MRLGWSSSSTLLRLFSGGFFQKGTVCVDLGIRIVGFEGVLLVFAEKRKLGFWLTGFQQLKPFPIGADLGKDCQ